MTHLVVPNERKEPVLGLKANGLPVNGHESRHRPRTMLERMGSSSFSGWFYLQTPQDLMQKLRHDHGRIKKDQADAYPAFDFAVTAYHLLEWHFYGRDDEKIAALNQHPELRICRHLANGAKHFFAANANMRGVQAQRLTGIVSDAASPDFNVPRLELVLTPDVSELGTSITMLELATIVVSFYESLGL